MRLAGSCVAALLCAALLAGCASVREAFSEETVGPSPSPTASATPDATELELAGEDSIEITGKLYELWVAEIVANPDRYMGKRLAIEGTLGVYPASTFVYRRGPGCCGDDGKMVGLEVECAGDMPPDGTWVIVEGVLGSYEHNGYTNLMIVVDRLEIP